MTSRSRIFLFTLPRRHLLQGAVGLALASAAGFPSRSVAAATSGEVAGAGLTELATFTDWRRTWDLIVPIMTAAALPRSFLLYDRAAGETALMSIDLDGFLKQIRLLTGWRRTWHSIVPSGFPRVFGVTGLIAYDNSAGLLTTMEIDQFGNLRELASYPTWRRAWTFFAPIGTAGFLAYDRSAGFAALYAVDAAGNVREVVTYNDWRETWDLIATGPFTTDAVPTGDILLYDRAARQAVGLTIQGSGERLPFASYSMWRSTWSGMQGGEFLFLGTASEGEGNLALLDTTNQELEFLEIGPGNLLSSQLLTPTPSPQTWTTFSALGPSLILLYDRAAGRAGFYLTDQAPVIFPTPTPLPTPTPIPTPSPVPIDPATGVTTVRLQQGGGNVWHTYKEKSRDPRTPDGRPAVITGVKNTDDKRIALIHVDSNGKRTGPVFLKANEVSDAFNGMAVGGDWEARITGGRADAPNRIAIDVRWDAGG